MLVLVHSYIHYRDVEYPHGIESLGAYNLLPDIIQ